MLLATGILVTVLIIVVIIACLAFIFGVRR